MKLFQYLLLINLLASPVYAADYYVDFAAGSDSNSGTSTGAAFKHCPGDANATGTASSTTLSAGDTVYFKGGIAYKGTMWVKWSGTSGSRITYDGNSSGSWGTGKAIIDNENETAWPLTKAFYMAAPANSNINIKNFEIRDIGGYASWPPAGDCSSTAAARSGIGIDFANNYTLSSGVKNITISDMYIHEVGEWHNEVPAADNTISGTGISLLNGTNIIIDNVEMTKVSVGISIKSASSGDGGYDEITVRNSNLHDYFRWGIDIAPVSANTSMGSIYIYDNEIHDMYQFTSTNWEGCNNNPHVDGIFYRGAASGGYTSVTWGDLNIYENMFYKTDFSTNGGTGTAAIYVSETGGDVKIYNNLFHGWGGAFGEISLNNQPSVGSNRLTGYVYGNSFFGDDRAVYFRPWDGGARDFIAIYVYNNIYYRTQSYTLMDIYPDDIDNVYMDYNIFYNTGGNLIYDYSRGYYSSLATFCSDTGWECNSSNVDPQYADTTHNALTLDSASNAIDAGTALGSPYDVDILGVSRPQNSVWDIGAYEWVQTYHPSFKGGSFKGGSMK